MRSATAPLAARASDLALLVFELDTQAYALPLHQVRRALRAVAIAPLPGAPAIVLGIVDLAGTVMPVIDMRRRLGHQPRRLRPSDHIIYAHTRRRPVALLVDKTTGVIDAPPEAVVPADGVLPGLVLVEGAVKLPGGLILIHDLDRLLSLEEDAAIGQAMELAEAPPASAVRRPRSRPAQRDRA